MEEKPPSLKRGKPKYAMFSMSLLSFRRDAGGYVGDAAQGVHGPYYVEDRLVEFPGSLHLPSSMALHLLGMMRDPGTPVGLNASHGLVDFRTMLLACLRGWFPRPIARLLLPTYY